MTWQVVPDVNGTWLLRFDGHDVGTISLLDTAPVSGVPLYPAQRVQQIASLFNDFDAHLDADEHVRTRREIVAAGWPSPREYHAEVVLCRDLVALLPFELRADVAAVYAAHDWPRFLTPAQMAVWQDEILELCARYERSVA